MKCVYILTNPSFPEWVKIGETDNLDERLKSLNATSSVPFAFRVYSTLEVDDPYQAEQDIHFLIDTINPDLRSKDPMENGRERVREFFKMSPEKADMILQRYAAIRGLKNLQYVAPSSEELKEYEQEEKKKPATFELLAIPVGSELTFIREPYFTCTVVNNNNTVSYKGKNTTLSAIAKSVLGYNMNGFKMFKFENETLWDRRIRMESSSF